MDLTGIDESIYEMFCVVACGLYIFATFASFTFGAGVFFLLAYIFIIWIWLD